jgi:hypothetical protein
MSAKKEVPVNSWKPQDSPWRWEIRLLLLSAMIVFVITVFIGLLKGQRIVQLSQDVLLTHVHAGTLGWITLSVFALALYLFGEGVTVLEKSTYLRVLSIVSVVAIPLYILAFLSGNYMARAVFGVPVLLVFVGFFGWTVARTSKLRLGLPHLAILAAMLTLVLGGIIGVSLQFQFALSRQFLPNGAYLAHPAMMVAGYLTLIGMALSEQSLIPRTSNLSIWGLLQILLLFLAGLVLGIGVLLDLRPLFGLNLLFNVGGVVVYSVRLAPRMLCFNWLGQNSSRFFAISALFVVFDIVLVTYLVAGVITGLYPNGNCPKNLLTALDHTVFVGVMTNALFGLIREATAERRSFWPWADHVLFWGMNIGVIGFIVCLIVDIRVLERVFTPIMGVSILLGLLAYALRMRRAPIKETVIST